MLAAAARFRAQLEQDTYFNEHKYVTLMRFVMKRKFR